MSDSNGFSLDTAIGSLIPESTGERRTGPASRLPGTEYLHIVDRLVKRYGKGPKPNARLSLYRRIQLAVDTHGQDAYRIVSEVILAAECAGANRHLYFCKAVKLRLGEAGLWPSAEQLEW